jgi:chitinase
VKPLTRYALLVLATLAGLASATRLAAASEPRDFRVIAYVPGWSMPAVIHAQKLTHINFAFAKIDGEGKAAFENPAIATALESLLPLRQDNPDLRILISVGGWTADGFSDAALSEASRQVFAESLVGLLRAHAVDGIDLDWEYPGQGVAGIRYRSEDKKNFTRLLKSVRAALDAASDSEDRKGRERYLLTIASADREYFEHTEMDRLHVHLDWINVMGYDFFNSLTATTGHHAGLFASQLSAPADRNADASIRQHLAAGIPRDKLVLGVAFYGRGFAGVTPAHRGLHQRYERYEGDHSYAELKDRYIERDGFVRYWDERAQAPFLWNEGTRTFITYDDPQSIRVKAGYVRDNRLGGMMFWELSQDSDDRLLDAILNSLDGSQADEYDPAQQ